MRKTILLRFGAEGSWERMGPRVAEATDLSVALRDCGISVPFTPVTAPGRAALSRRDLSPAFLPHNGSTLNHALGLRDDQLSDLQRDVIYGISVPLRTGLLILRRATKWKPLRKLDGLLKRLRKPSRRHLKLRQP